MSSCRCLLLILFCTQLLQVIRCACSNQDLMDQLIDLLNIDSEEVRDYELEIRLSNLSESSTKWSQKILEISNRTSRSNPILLRNLHSSVSDGSNNDGNKTEMLILVICMNAEEFFSELSQIVSNDEQHSGNIQWRPKYFLVYPGQISDENQNEFFTDTNFASVIKNISIDEDIYVITNAQSRENISVWELYSIGEIHFYHQLKLSEDCHIDWYNFINKFSRRRHFGNATLRTIAPSGDEINKEEVRFGHTLNGDAVFVDGMSVSMLRYLKLGLNFREYAIEGQRTYEIGNSSGILGGDAAEIIKGTADLAIEQSTITLTRGKHIRFLHPTYFDGLDAFFVQPPVSTARNLYIAPFNLDLWLAMLGSWFLLVIGMKICVWVKGLRAEIEYEDKEVLKDAFLWAIGSVCQQGWHIQPVSMSLRIIFVVGYLTGLLCFVAFSASIVSLLSVKVVPIKTMDDLDQSNFHFFTGPDSASLDVLGHFFKNQPGYPNGTLVSDAEAIPQLTKSKSAVLTYPDFFYAGFRAAFNERFDEKEVCDTYSSVKAAVNPSRAAMMINKKSPFIDFFNCLILLMRERGLNLRYINKYGTETQVKCLVNTTGFKQALGMLDVLTAFYILAGGHALSFAILSIEVTLAKFTKTIVHTIRE